MGYTYDEFMSAADSAGLTKAFSKQDLQVAQQNPEFGFGLLSLMKDRSKATTAEQQLLATEAANQLRKNYGIYNTGTTGTESTYAPGYGSKITGTLDAIDGYGSFQYANQEGYQKLLDSVVNPEGFSYNPETDPSYKAYAKAYMREGERASADALAQAAAATGGRPSSYAVSAAQQAANYYAAQLADALPSMEQNAYSRYLNDFNNRVTALNAMNTDKQFAYSDWLQRYNMMQNSLQNYQNQDATDYQRYQDAWNRDYTIGQDTEKSAAAGAYKYDTHGYTEEQIKELQRAAGIKVDGIWGPDTQAAYERIVEKGSDFDGNDSNTIDPSLYEGWKLSEWIEYFSAIAKDNPAAAEYHMKELNQRGILSGQIMPHISLYAISGEK